MPYFSIKVPAEYAGDERLDRYVASLPNGMNRSKLKTGVTQVLVNGKAAKLSARVKACDQIDLLWEENIPDDIEPQDIPLDVVYEDDNVCVVNKAQGMVTHPAAGNWTGTLVNALLFRWSRQSVPLDKTGAAQELLAQRRPGIVHRLDKDTSGIIITAKNRGSEEFLQAQFQNKAAFRVKKEYIAIGRGRPQHKSGTVRTWIIRDPKNRKRFRAVPLDDPVGKEQGKYAETDYRCIACYGEYSLFKLRIKTGRTHQIRVHLKFLNCPVLGDPIYTKPDKAFSSATLMLHSRRLRIRIPGVERPMTFKAATPERFKGVLKTLHAEYKKVILPEDGAR